MCNSMSYTSSVVFEPLKNWEGTDIIIDLLMHLQQKSTHNHTTQKRQADSTRNPNSFRSADGRRQKGVALPKVRGRSRRSWKMKPERKSTELRASSREWLPRFLAIAGVARIITRMASSLQKILEDGILERSACLPAIARTASCRRQEADPAGCQGYNS